MGSGNGDGRTFLRSWAEHPQPPTTLAYASSLPFLPRSGTSFFVTETTSRPFMEVERAITQRFRGSGFCAGFADGGYEVWCIGEPICFRPPSPNGPGKSSCGFGTPFQRWQGENQVFQDRLLRRLLPARSCYGEMLGEEKVFAHLGGERVSEGLINPFPSQSRANFVRLHI